MVVNMSLDMFVNNVVNNVASVVCLLPTYTSRPPLAVIDLVGQGQMVVATLDDGPLACQLFQCCMALIVSL